MDKTFLLGLYKNLYGEDFVFSDFSHRLKMQKGIYLLQELGAPVSNYSFSWYKHGPYSQTLMNDMISASCINYDDSVILSENTNTLISKLSDIVEQYKNTPYDVKDWIECLGSLYFLKNRRFSSSASDDIIIEALIQQKTHLSDRATNEKALKLINENF